MSKFSSHFKMDEEDVILYVKEKLDFFEKGAKLRAEEIGDGNINYVFRVWDVNAKTSVVVKQADTLLRSSGRPLDVDRNRIEGEVLMMQEKLAPGLVPKVYQYDPIMCCLVMEDIGDHENLRKALLERKVFLRLADHISTFIVNTLLPTTDLVMDSGMKKDNVKRYVNKDLCKISEDLVFTEPFINYKGRNIVLEENLLFMEKNLYQDKKLILEAGILKHQFMNHPQGLIHGDLHSGSIFVTKQSTKVLDPEFAFYGPIGYDLGNVIGNLFFAWVNAYVTDKSQGANEFIQWIESTIDEIVLLFKEKFIELYKEIVTDVMAKEVGFMEWYLEGILSDTAGFAGLEMIRRVVGDAKVQDITDINKIEDRIRAERMLIKIGKAFIMNRSDFQSGEEYVKEFYRNK
ncbi:5-methylthioribose kinase [Alkaliphilus metalliredigens QYMF]|uniref:S-methyl-5-thioribose kinase n=1 Tax=Alkaliphilus metalliredigens (strain QYMF) TaxID=293826 RepID=A6TUK7_ALKMQ|nr:S-methyl-5-thioribose kinase [Alkaliphilus metalliredigens]ABR49875.1 5-methylthioribose kinase [Alkaliphilus metalliredigens QYMF]